MLTSYIHLKEYLKGLMIRKFSKETEHSNQERQPQSVTINSFGKLDLAPNAVCRVPSQGSC
ncbi:hypothetical protein VDG1235_1118 [Verrucomicrobiia bacterium DG1235]|nr:hypothetical protein VDG1235_1118 [Verrucomicrobiae bacterium DG1235]